MLKIERDPSIASLEQELYSRLAAAIPPDPVLASPPSTKQLPSDNKPVSVEDAIRELQELEKQGLL